MMALISETISTCLTGLLLSFLLLVVANNFSSVARHLFVIIRKSFPETPWGD